MYSTIAAIFEVGPNDVFLGEAEHAKPASTHGGVYGDPRISHQLRAFIKSHPVTTQTEWVSNQGRGNHPSEDLGGPASWPPTSLLCFTRFSRTWTVPPLLLSSFPARLGDLRGQGPPVHICPSSVSRKA